MKKRFEYDKDTCCFLDHNEWGIKGKSIEEIEKLLNALHDENQQLKQHIKALDQSEEATMKFNLELKKENEQLREALKNSYINEICENCKYGHYWISETYGYGLEGEFECKKKHFGNEHWKHCELTECDDFELKLNGGDGK